VFPAQLLHTSTLIVLAAIVPVIAAIVVFGVIAVMVVRRLNGADLVSTLEVTGRTLVALLPSRKAQGVLTGAPSGPSSEGEQR
jgi:hypothetical protein